MKNSSGYYDEKEIQKEEDLAINLLNESPHKLESDEQIKITRLWQKYKDF